MCHYSKPPPSTRLLHASWDCYIATLCMHCYTVSNEEFCIQCVNHLTGPALTHSLLLHPPSSGPEDLFRPATQERSQGVHCAYSCTMHIRTCSLHAVCASGLIDNNIIYI